MPAAARRVSGGVLVHACAARPGQRGRRIADRAGRVPTSRATRVTSSANEDSWSAADAAMVVMPMLLAPVGGVLADRWAPGH
jgi:hypothetical protein